MKSIRMHLLFLETALDLQNFDSFREAAAHMEVGPSAIGYRLKRVEEWVGAGQLYYRRRGHPDLKNHENPNIKPTPAGEAFFAGVKQGLEYIGGARQDAQAVGKVKRVEKGKLVAQKTPTKKKAARRSKAATA